ncbi:MAG: YgiQ family radical SAM protein [Succinivibrionaceae bacterium]|nr:YgiQ family radical SAM protein [Succinivibrionaceae bacterium]
MKTIASGDHFLPMSRKEMESLGWDQCDVILVTGDAYVDHPSFAMAILGRTLERFDFRVGIISQPDWRSCLEFRRLGAPRLFWGVSSGNMDSMVNHYTADKKIRHDDAYTPGNVNGKRPDRAATVYAQRCREAFKGVPVVVGGIEASLRRLAHYDYWSETVKRPLIFDAKADMLLYGAGERSIVELAIRLDRGESIREITDIRGSAVIVSGPPEGFVRIDEQNCSAVAETSDGASKPYLLLPSYEEVKADKIRYARSMYLLHRETNPYCARHLMQPCGDRAVWINPPPLPLAEAEMDLVYDLPYRRRPHPSYRETIPAYEMIKTSITAMRGCFGGCAFCTIAAHAGRIIQCRSEKSILREIRDIRLKVPGYAGVISDIGGPSANMYGLGCGSQKAMKSCRRSSCLYPNVCRFLKTDQSRCIELYRAARSADGVRRVFISSGIRLDLAVLYPQYIRELAEHHVSGHLKIAPEHIADNALACMHKPGRKLYDEFERLFCRYSQEAGLKQQIIPYFIACHPGTTDRDMIELAIWLKKHDLRVDQVQNFYPTPLSNATTMYYAGFDTDRRISDDGKEIFCVRGEIRRRRQKAILRYHDPENHELIRQALLECGMKDLIGSGPNCLVPYGTGRRRGDGGRSGRDHGGSRTTGRGSCGGNRQGGVEGGRRERRSEGFRECRRDSRGASGRSQAPGPKRG